MQQLAAVGRVGEEAVVAVDVEHQVLPLQREGDALTHVELQTEATCAVDLLFLVVLRQTTDGLTRVGELHHTTTCGEVGGNDGIGPEVKLELTAEALDVGVGVVELVEPLSCPVGTRVLGLALKVIAALIEPTDLEERTEAEAGTDPPVGSIAKVKLLAPLGIPDDGGHGEADILYLC